MGNLGFSELAVIAVVALLVVSPKRLPELAKALGEAVRVFRDSLNNTHPKSVSDSDAASSDDPT